MCPKTKNQLEFLFCYFIPDYMTLKCIQPFQFVTMEDYDVDTEESPV